MEKLQLPWFCVINTFTWGRPTGGSPWFITIGRNDSLSNS